MKVFCTCCGRKFDEEGRQAGRDGECIFCTGHDYIDIDALMKVIRTELYDNKTNPRFISYNVIDLQKAEDVIRKVLVTTLKGSK